MIFIDDIKEYPLQMISAAARRYGRHWCHLFTLDDDLHALHQFAINALGLKIKYFQNKKGFPHYDLTPAKRKQARECGARYLSLADYVRRKKTKELER